MKKTILLSVFSIICLTLTAQSGITYKSFGDGWAIPMNANMEIDVDEDGIIDFYVNQYEGELGFSPVSLVGCFVSPAYGAYNNIGSRELSLLEEGDSILLNNSNLATYIDGDRGSAFSLTGGIADGWVDQKDVYIGFAIFIYTSSTSPGGIFNGWIKVNVDTTTNELIIKEWAYSELSSNYDNPIAAGDKGENTTSVKQLENIDQLSISPNPASDRVQINFDYSGTENLNVVIQNSVGKTLYRTDNNIPLGSTNLNVSTQNWSSGLYFIRFETPSAIRTEKLIITK